MYFTLRFIFSLKLEFFLQMLQMRILASVDEFSFSPNADIELQKDEYIPLQDKKMESACDELTFLRKDNSISECFHIAE
jgi:hypothetical protein